MRQIIMVVPGREIEVQDDQVSISRLTHYLDKAPNMGG